LALIDDFGRYWAILGDFGRFWTILDDFGRFWTILGEFGRFWPILGDFRRFLGNFGPYSAIFDTHMVTLAMIFKTHYLCKRDRNDATARERDSKEFLHI
jgi:hypothetical protein